MSWILGFFIAIWILDAVRLRGRLNALSSVSEITDREADGAPFAAVRAAAVDLPAALLARATAYARTMHIDVLDLIPQRLSTLRAFALAQAVDPARYRQSPLANGYTAGHAILVAPDIAQRSGIDTDAPRDAVAMMHAAARLKHYAPRRTDLVIIPGLVPAGENSAQRLAVFRENTGSFSVLVLLAQLAMFAVLIAGLIRPETRVLGLCALAAFHLQPLLTVAGTSVRPPDLLWVTLLRLPMELARWLGMVFGPWRASDTPETQQVAAQRSTYQELLHDGLSRFFAQRQQNCPICGSSDLAVHLKTNDMFQHKPGQFTLERCRDCEHIFQNPPLTVEGLNFYYKDFYDGLGEKRMAQIFGFADQQYVDRAQMMEEAREPKRWLDVGAGHGHFCCRARDIWPQTHFDGLDLADSIEEAERRGWVDKSYRGLFPDVAPGIANAYDVVSMAHYLEHTQDPRAEIRAAQTALVPGGHLMIEVPDPECRLGHVLGRYWLPWFQPQHQHLLSAANLERLLADYGFTPVCWHRGRAHQKVDFVFAVLLLLDRIAPPENLPWRPQPALLGRLWRFLVLTAGAPLVLGARVLDAVIAPAMRRRGRSNTYRVLARRDPGVASCPE